MANNIPITDNTTLLETLKAQANALPKRGDTSSADAPDLSGITAAAGDILAGKKSVDSSGNAVTGTMTNNGAWTYTKASNGTVAIPEGYHNGSGSVTVNVPTEEVTTGELAVPTISVNSLGVISAVSKVKTSGYISTSETKNNTYSMTCVLGGELTPSASDQTIDLAGKYCSGNYTVCGDSNLKAANIKSGVSIFGVTGTYSGTTTNQQYRTLSVTPTFGTTDYGEMCCVIENGVCAITPTTLLLYADLTNWKTVSAWSWNLIIAAYHSVSDNTTTVMYIDTSSNIRVATYDFSRGADRGYYERNGGYISWGFMGDEYSTANAAYTLICMA